MSITRVTNTRSCKNAIDYAMKEKNLKIGKENAMPRVLLADGNGVFPEFAYEQIMATLNKYNKGSGDHVQMYRVVQSFRQTDLDYRKQEDIRKANAIGLELAETLFPDHKSLVVTQADGKGHMLHNHVLVCAVNTKTGKSLRSHEKSWYTVAKANDTIIQKYGIEPIQAQKYDRFENFEEQQMKQDNKPTWKEKIRLAIDDVKQDGVTNLQAFKQQLKEKHDVEFEIRGKTITYRIQVPSDKEKNEDGSPLMMTRKVRGKRLGELYTKEGVENEFEQELERARQQRIKQQQQQQFNIARRIRELTEHNRRSNQSDKRDEEENSQLRRTIIDESPIIKKQPGHIPPESPEQPAKLTGKIIKPITPATTETTGTGNQYNQQQYNDNDTKSSQRVGTNSDQKNSEQPPSNKQYLPTNTDTGKHLTRKNEKSRPKNDGPEL